MKSKTIIKQHAPLYDSSEQSLFQLVHPGSSGATLWVIQAKTQIILRKHTSVNPVKLLEQYEWLNAREHCPYFPCVSNPKEGDNAFSYDMTFYDGAQNLAFYLAASEIDNPHLLSGLIRDLEASFYVSSDQHFSAQSYLYYLREKFFKKVKACELTRPDLQPLFNAPTIIINGREYINFPGLWKFFSSSNCVSFFHSFNSLSLESIHGDLTAENILLASDGIKLIDPNQENHISTMAVDMAKIYQSIHSHYEHLDMATVSATNSSIDFTLQLDEVYTDNCHKLLNALESELTPNLPEVYFHEAIHFARMLPYKLKKPETFLIYYAKMIMLFNSVIQ